MQQQRQAAGQANQQSHTATSGGILRRQQASVGFADTEASGLAPPFEGLLDAGIDDAPPNPRLGEGLSRSGSMTEMSREFSPYVGPHTSSRLEKLQLWFADVTNYSFRRLYSTAFTSSVVIENCCFLVVFLLGVFIVGDVLGKIFMGQGTTWLDRAESFRSSSQLSIHYHILNDSRSEDLSEHSIPHDHWSEWLLFFKVFDKHIGIKFDVWDVFELFCAGYFYTKVKDWQKTHSEQSQFDERNIEYGTSRFNISLNTEINGKFEMRTIKECRTSDIFHHPQERALLKEAAQIAEKRQRQEEIGHAKGTMRPENMLGSFLFLKDRNSATRVANFAKAKLSELTAQAHLATDLATDVKIVEAKYAFALTYETSHTKKIERKLRLLIVRSDFLDKILERHRNGISVPSIRHELRGRSGAAKYFIKRYQSLVQLAHLRNDDNRKSLQGQALIGSEDAELDVLLSMIPGM